MTHYADNSRYQSGFDCPFIRLAKYHLLGNGYTPLTEPIETAIGHVLHHCIETVLRYLLACPDCPLPNEDKVTELISPIWSTPSSPFSFTTNPGSLLLSEVVGLTHAWCRAVLPWLESNYTLVSVEEEFSLDLGDSITWMARPDLVLLRKSDKTHVIADFKSTRSKADRVARINSVSLQSIMNSYAVSQRYGPVSEVQIHMLQLGTETWPTPITHAYYRPGQLPFVSDDWQPRSRRPDGGWLGKLYRRVPVHEHRPVSGWVWSMPPDPLRECVPVDIRPADPEVEGLKVILALSSIRSNERHWRSLLSSIDWSAATLTDLATLAPRTFACIQYSRECEYSSLCFTPHLFTKRLDDTQLRALGFVPRTPHHPQEGQTKA